MKQNHKYLFTFLLIAVLLIGTVYVLFQVKSNRTQNTNIFGLNPSGTIDSQYVAGFPDVPIIRGAVLLNSSANDAQQILYRGTWVISGNVKTVMAWYLTELKKDGWTVDIPPGNLDNQDIQYAELIRGDVTQPKTKLQLSVIKNIDQQSVKIEMGFPAPDNEVEEE